MTMLTLRYMRLTDIEQVVRIDRQSFSTPWGERSYAYEIQETDYSHMLVLTLDQPAPLKRWQQWAWRMGWRFKDQVHEVVGYGGLWRLGDEAHISTIALHPTYRGRGWGALLLAAMLLKGAHLGAHYAALEVRVSNQRAQQLYQRSGFVVHGVKTAYYHDNGEDAYDMRLPLTDEAVAAARATLISCAAPHLSQDLYSIRKK
jgi:[ribosomal protein S18]-alanine N-acetyltransferase